MTPQDIITQVREELVEPIEGFWTDTELLQWINRFELDFNNECRILESSISFNTVIGQRNYTLPSNWLSAGPVMINTPNLSNLAIDNWQRLNPTRLEKVVQERVNFMSNDTTTFTAPDSYYIYGTEINVVPTPDRVYAVFMYFKSKPTTLTLVTQPMNLDDSFKEYAISFVLWKAWSKEQEFDRAKDHAANYVKGLTEARKWMKKRSRDQRYNLDIVSQIGFSGGSTGFNPFSNT